MDPSWLQGRPFEYIQIMFAAISSINTWGTIYAFNFPHIKEKAKEIMYEKGMLLCSEERLLRSILVKRN